MAGVGDVVTGISSVAATTGTLDIKPGAGIEWVIHNIYYAAPTGGSGIEFYKTDGTNAIKFDSDITQGGRLGMAFHCTNAQWIQLKNTGTAALFAGYDGIQTK